MRILIAHNFYQQPGGEDQVFKAETNLLERRGHQVFHFTKHNDDVADVGKLALAKKTIWNQQTYQELRASISDLKPDVVHFHNTLPLISPAAYHAVKDAGLPVIQTLHNYRLMCPKATLYRNNSVCEDCIGLNFKWPSIKHSCYRDNRAASAVISSMLSLHQLRGTYTNKVDAYIALTEFSKNKFIEAGLPADKLFVKPNFLDFDPGHSYQHGTYALFVGRLTEEKGVRTLLESWRLVSDVPLKIVGGGPLSDEVAHAAQENPLIEYVGFQSRDEVMALMKNAMMLVFPSLWYEGLPVTIIEAFAVGLPIVASRLGNMSTLITEHETGLLFEANNPQDLSQQVATLKENMSLRQTISDASRKVFELEYSDESNYRQLIRIYEMFVA